ncbi:LamG-like jellyroll fold domain-containing protein [Sphingobium sp. CR2-8]|uniref:LamG-like jellyroll fold domain-containing protein n=1 Tax=Sphingobium sp. CR2-8 TaxID=1306534 RepID=UPI002DB7DF62|nr:LamG-like jellyroll fold domain-containing protein [Sphingobium sp. CR2-8]MEC3910029.1 LamG-like jellyroll fold domain-containing protein [Sphingobium sp. CR2-8]
MHRQLLIALAVASFAAGSGFAKPAPDQDRAWRLDFDDNAPVDATFPGATIHSQFPQPERVPGVHGQAWRSDGFSSWISAPLKLSAKAGFTASTWVALESYPSDREVPADQLTPASIINQATRSSGFDIFIDTFGRWGMRVSTDRGQLTLQAPDVFPLSHWVHVAATYDPRSGSASLYLNGALQKQDSVGMPAAFVSASTPLQIARSWQDATAAGFRLNGLNAAFDDIAVVDRAQSADHIRSIASDIKPPPVSQSLIVPPSRFAGDPDRPVYHAMPAANWTNEPHGLVRRGRWWHLFYQRTPNGPFKTMMHWGHMRSRDLVNWTHMPDALWPTLDGATTGSDMKGIWSGSVVLPPTGPAYAFYTSVNHDPDGFNPGISVATSIDPDLRTWRKAGPILNTQGVRDFRDPVLWREGGAWHMLIGASLPDGTGGLVHYRCRAMADLHCWHRQPPIAPFAQMDIGSQIWEMPIFQSLGDGRYILLVNPIGGRVSKNGDPATRAIYWIGTWDGRQFRPDHPLAKPLDLLPGHLSPTVARDAQGRLTAIGIVDERRSAEAQKSAGWAHLFSLPRIWYVMKDGTTLGQRPSSQLTQLRNAAHSRRMKFTNFVGRREGGDLGPAFEMDVDFGRRPPLGRYGVWLAGSPTGDRQIKIEYDPKSSTITLDGRLMQTDGHDGEASVLEGAYDAKAFGPPRRFHVFVDHSVADVFINGAAAFSFRLYAGPTPAHQFGLSSTSPANATLKAWAMDGARFRYDLDMPPVSVTPPTGAARTVPSPRQAKGH